MTQTRFLDLNVRGPYLVDGVRAELTEETAVRAAGYAEAERVCPTLAGFCFRLWDLTPEEDRAGLRSKMEMLYGTQGGREDALRRAYIAVDFGCRTSASAALRAHGYVGAADELAALTPITDERTIHEAAKTLDGVTLEEDRAVDEVGVEMAVEHAILAVSTVHVDPGLAAAHTADAAYWAGTYRSAAALFWPILKVGRW